MRFWIVLMTVCSLLSLPFSGSMASDSVSHGDMMQNATEHAHSMPEHAVDEAEHCPDSMGMAETLEDCCVDTPDGPECTSCPPDCGHCAMSDHGSSAALTMQQTYTPSVALAPLVSHISFYQLLSGQPTPPPIIS